MGGVAPLSERQGQSRLTLGTRRLLAHQRQANLSNVLSALHDTSILDSAGHRQTIPKDTVLICLNYHTATHLTADGFEFKPERWLDEKTGQFDASKVWSRPFGGGTRGCYGYRTAVSPVPSRRRHLAPYAGFTLITPTEPVSLEQMTFLRLFLAQLSLAYFVRPLPAKLRTSEIKQTIIRRPKTNFVGLQRWDEVEEVKEKQG